MTYMPPASPVNLDASITSLSAGSLTTVARADHVHTVSNVVNSIVAGTGITVSGATGSVTVNSASYALLAKVSTTDSITSVLTISNIPQTYSHIIIQASNVQTTSTTLYSESVYVRLNGQATQSYRDNTTTFKTYLTAFSCPTSYNGGGYYKGFSSVWVPMYTAAIYKISSHILYSTSFVDSVTFIQYVSTTQQSPPLMWMSTAAVTSVSITASQTAFVVGTTLSVYGVS